MRLIQGLSRLMACCMLLILAVAPVSAQEPKVLHVPRYTQFESLDPPRQADGPSSILVDLLYSKLLTYSYLERPYKLVPELLAKMPELASDKVTYTFTLRKGVQFIDDKCFEGGKGRELIVDDVLYSLKRYADANVNFKSWDLMEGAVVGLDEYREATRKPTAAAAVPNLDVTGFKKIDNYRFTIKLKRENPLFLSALTSSVTAIVPFEAVKLYKDQLGVNPVGSGPFILRNIERKGILHLTKNANYYGVYPSVGAPGDAEKGLLKDAGRKLPLVDVINMPLIEEAQPAALKFLKGELDWQALDRANFTKMVVRQGNDNYRLADEFAAKFNIDWTVAITTTYTKINMNDALLGKNKALRQALAHLTDTRGEIEVLLNGRGRKLQSIVPYDLPGSERDTGAAFRDYDVAVAKKLLIEAGFPNGKGLPPLTMVIGATDAQTRNMFDFVKVKAALAGVQLTATFMDSPTALKNITSGNFQLSASSWSADYPDAESYYSLLFSKNLAPLPNSGSFKNAEYDKAYEASRYLANGTARYALFKTMNDIIREEVPIIIGRNPLLFGVTQKWLQNFKRNVLQTELPFLDVDMASKKKGL